MHSLKKGYTLIEVVVVIGIISILSVGMGVGYGNLREFFELEEAKISIIGTLKNYRDKAYYRHRNYNFNLNTTSKYIEVWETTDSSKKERIHLPKNLRYRVPTTNMGSIVAGINSNGNFSNSFSLYIFGKGDRAIYRLGFYSFLQLKYFKINLYKNVGATGATYGNIANYHQTSAAQNLTGWEQVR